MVTAGKQDHARELDQSIVQSRDRFHIQVVCRLIQDQHIGAGDHHLGKHAADALATGENAQLLHTVFPCKQHSSQESADIGGILDLRKSGQPFRNRQIRIKFLAVIPREVCPAGRNAPLKRAGIRFHLIHQD